ncbi:hypothetical protein [Extibacter muris]|nr:hypothetical protein [Extibacter muris]
MAAGTYRLTAYEIQPACRPLFCIYDAKEGGRPAVFDGGGNSSPKYG